MLFLPYRDSSVSADVTLWNGKGLPLWDVEDVSCAARAGMGCCSIALLLAVIESFFDRIGEDSLHPRDRSSTQGFEETLLLFPYRDISALVDVSL
jgi:hypothetical protein